jgi:hypothetical protein
MVKTWKEKFFCISFHGFYSNVAHITRHCITNYFLGIEGGKGEANQKFIKWPIINIFRLLDICMESHHRTTHRWKKFDALYCHHNGARIKWFTYLIYCHNMNSLKILNRSDGKLQSCFAFKGVGNLQVYKNRNLDDFFIFFDSTFFSKMTLLGLILCRESIARISEAWKRFPDLGK